MKYLLLESSFCVLVDDVKISAAGIFFLSFTRTEDNKRIRMSIFI